MMLAAAGNGSATFSLHGWVAFVVLLGSVAAAGSAVAVFIRKVIGPLVDSVAELRRDWPVLVDIATRFSNDGQETITTELRALASNDELSAANQRAMMAQLDTVIAQVGTLDTKLSDTRHKWLGDVAGLQASTAASMTMVEAIVKTSEDLQAVRQELHLLQERLDKLQRGEG